MSTTTFYHALLRPAILQILRAVGFHAARPSVVDTLTDVAARYIMLLGARTAERAAQTHNGVVPDVTDVRLAMGDCGLLAPGTTATEEVWRELLRPPIEDVPERNGLRAGERVRRDEEDTAEVREFVEWFKGPVHREIKRIAGLLAEEGQVVELEDGVERGDYLTALKKKHSKTGEASRFQGTVLGMDAETRHIKIEGGPESFQEWQKAMRENAAKRNLAILTPPPDDDVN